MSLLSFYIPCDVVFMSASILAIELIFMNIIFSSSKYQYDVFIQDFLWYSHISFFVKGSIVLIQGTFLFEVLSSNRILSQGHSHFVFDLIQALRIFWNDSFLEDFFLFEYQTVFFQEIESTPWIYFMRLKSFHHEFSFIHPVSKL